LDNCRILLLSWRLCHQEIPITVISTIARGMEIPIAIFLSLLIEEVVSWVVVGAAELSMVEGLIFPRWLALEPKVAVELVDVVDAVDVTLNDVELVGTLRSAVRVEGTPRLVIALGVLQHDFPSPLVSQQKLSLLLSQDHINAVPTRLLALQKFGQFGEFQFWSVHAPRYPQLSIVSSTA